jgi:hypothetical protein
MIDCNHVYIQIIKKAWMDIVSKFDDMYSHSQRWVKIRMEWNGRSVAMYEFILKKYKDVMVKLTKVAEGGPGAPEGYENRETQNDEWFQNYTRSVEFIPLLCWVY